MAQMNPPTPQQIAAYLAQMQAQQQPQPQPQMQPQPQQMPPVMQPPTMQPPVPQGTQAHADDDYIGDLPPASLPAGTYDWEVQYVDTKSGTSDSGVAWENLRYKFTVLSGQFVGHVVTVGISTKFPRKLYALAQACGKPIAADAMGKTGFSKRSINGCRVTAELKYNDRDYADLFGFKPLAR